jgi:hypothetical protein
MTNGIIVFAHKKPQGFNPGAKLSGSGDEVRVIFRVAVAVSGGGFGWGFAGQIQEQVRIGQLG